MTHDIQPSFRALSDPTRREILRLLCQQDMTIAALTQEFDMTRAAVKKHLTILCDGNLVHSESQGRTRINRINPDGLRPVLDWLSFFDHFWDTRLDALKTAIERKPQ